MTISATIRTKRARALQLMRERWLTPLDSLNEIGLMALSQCVTALKKEGHTILSERVPGQSYHRYRCVVVKPNAAMFNE